MITITIIKRDELNKLPGTALLQEVTKDNLMLGAKRALESSDLFIVCDGQDFFVMKNRLGMIPDRVVSLTYLNTFVSEYLRE